MDAIELRYSDSDLAEFKEIIIGKKKTAENDLQVLKSILANEGNGTQDTSSEFKGTLEEGEMGMSLEEVGKLAQRQYLFIKNLQAALVRIENKTYGICRQTGGLIPKERLRVVPHATLSIEAKIFQNQKERRGK